VSNAFFYKTEIRIVHNRGKSRKVSCISQTVKTDDPIVRILVQHMENKVASDKSGSAGNNNSHNGSPFIMIFLIKRIYDKKPAHPENCFKKNSGKSVEAVQIFAVQNVF